MATQNNNNQTKRGPGRPPGSKNKPKDGSQSSSKSSSGNKSGSKSGSKSSGNKSQAMTKQPMTQDEIREQRIARLQQEYDRERRNVDVIWSITLFAIGLFLFFTVVMDTTGAFGATVHDICLGLFGAMAYVLPFLSILFGILLLSRKMQHIGLRTLIFNFLIFLNMCVLNSYRFIDVKNINYGFGDMADFYGQGVELKGGGVLGMEIGSLLAKFFGMPGLVIIASAILIISIFLVANSPISRFFENLSKKAERRRILREMEEAETAKVQMAVASTATPGADPVTGLVRNGVEDIDLSMFDDEPEESKPFWKSIFNGISKEEEPKSVPSQREQYAAARKAAPAVASEPEPEPAPREIVPPVDLTPLPEQKNDSVMEAVTRDTLFGKLARKFQEAGKGLGTDTYPGEYKPADKNNTANAPGKDEIVMTYDDVDDGDFGYPGRRINKISSDSGSGLNTAAAASGVKTYGLGDPDDIGHSGSLGLSGAKPASSGAGLSDFSVTGGNAAGAGIAMRRNNRKTAESEPKATPEIKRPAASKPASPAPAQQTAPATPEDTAQIAAEEAALAAGFETQTEDYAYELPPVSLLKKGAGNKQMMSDYQLEQKADLLEKTLNDFGVDAKVITVTQGASVTRYEVQPATGVKVSSITRLADDIALNMRAKTIRIEAPIPGKAAVGIEVENDKPSPVLIRELIDSDEFREAKSKISFVVGKDISGNNIIADLKSMPHLLIAGATGSGKSVCINTIITSFLYKAKPSELKLIMIDPKVVELANYNGIPHMLTPVVTDARKAARALAIAVEEMDKRYELFAKEGVKDLESYNELMRANHEPQNCKPQVVIIIDELADLMMASPSEVENSICRLAQKARAAGMHLIVATQRPSVDVVTGLIKANIPSRIAFSVASQFDSRTILDMAGAEKLLGKGDMLFSPVGSNKPYRVQGPFISDSETEKVIKFVKKEGGAPEYDEDLRNAIENADKKGGSEPQDELTDDAIAFILKSKQASVSMLQRRFRIGYNRAARIIDEIEEKGIIGPSDGSRPRQVLVTEDEYYNGSSAAAEADEQYEVDPQRMAEIEEHVSGKPHMNLVGSRKSEPADESAGSAAPAAGTGTSASSAVDYFNSLPESVRRQILDADSHMDD